MNWSLASALLALLTADAGLSVGAEVQISEFMASNSRSLADEDGEFSDWVEIHNAGAVPINLAGWFLTDTTNRLAKWQFPATNLAAGQYLIVFASEKDRREAGRPLHTNFKLAAEGEYLALLDPQTNIVSAFSPLFPRQAADVSFGLGSSKRTVSLISPESPARILVPLDNVLGEEWIQPDFNDSNWLFGTGAVGYETSPADYAAIIKTDVRAQMSGLRRSCYVRAPFVVTNRADLAGWRLCVQYDDGFLVWLNGELIASRNAPANPAWNSLATGDHPDAQAVVPEEFNLTAFQDRFVSGTNWLAIQGLNTSLTSSDFLIAVALEADRDEAGQTGLRYFKSPTPGAANPGGDASVGPLIHSVTHEPAQPFANQPLVIRAQVVPAFDALSAVALQYRVMFDAEVVVPLLDDGAHGDGAPGDGVFGGIIPAGVAAAGQMIRYRVSATDAAGTESRWPLYLDPSDSEQYFGTVVADPSIASRLPVLHQFVQNTGAADTRTGTRAALFYLGEFYDNILISLHGQSSAGFPKKPYNLDFNRDHRFLYRTNIARVKDLKLLTNWGDKSFVRNTLAYEMIQRSGSMGHFAFPIRVHRNGQFYTVLDLVEDGDDRWLERLGRDPEGALYKMYNAMSSASGNEKKTRKQENTSDLQALITALSESRPLTDRVTDAYDILDLPQVVSYFAALALISSQDHGHKNYYLYRDTPGSGEWSLLPWDVDLSWGRNWTGFGGYLTDTLYQDNVLNL